MNNKIGEYILLKRKEIMFTQSKLAEKVGVSTKTISKWECGITMPNYENVDNLCKALNITPNELLNGGESKSKLTENESKMLFPRKERSLLNNITFSLNYIFIAIIVCLTVGCLIGTLLLSYSTNQILINIVDESIANKVIAENGKLVDEIFAFLSIFLHIFLWAAIIFYGIKLVKNKILKK